MVEDDDTEDPYVFGDEAAANDVRLPKGQLRQLRVQGKLKGAVAKFGHRTIGYHRRKLRRRVAEIFEESA
jgi:hypothetical protein